MDNRNNEFEETEQLNIDKEQAELKSSCPDSNEPEAQSESVHSLTFKISSSLFETLEILVLSIVAVLLVFTFCFRLCRVSGSSMDKTLANGETLITSDLFYEPKQGDIIVFHLSNDFYTEPLVKRVIALEGQTVTVNIDTGKTYVDGQLIDEEYAYFGDSGKYNKLDLYSLFDTNHITANDSGQDVFTVTVPEGTVFVMGDNRNNSSDSRNRYVGFVDKDTILGKALYRLSPFTALS